MAIRMCGASLMTVEEGRLPYYIIEAAGHYIIYGREKEKATRPEAA